jgi:NAD(P)-dependent dehydrogenase (short-subunit alcohol dehydrogenase family)
MKVAGKIVVVTGGAEGIGAALARRFAKEGAAHVAVVDHNEAGAKATAEAIGGKAYAVDVSNPDQIAAMVAAVEAEQGRIDLFCSNAGIGDGDPDRANAASSPDAVWMRAWGVNVMAHVYAARAALPGMIARGEGYFLNTVSAAGLLSQVGSAVYSTTKHAAVGFAEHLAIAEREKGIGVSILCPQAVDTPMLGGAAGSQNVDGVLSPEQVAAAVVEGLADERFLILPHPQVTTYMQRKTGDYDRWLKGMVRLRRGVIDGAKGAR